MYVFMHLFLERQKTDQEKENIPPKKKSQGINILNVGSANLQPSSETTPTPIDQDIDPVSRPILPVSLNRQTRTLDPETIPIDQNIDQQPVSPPILPVSLNQQAWTPDPETIPIDQQPVFSPILPVSLHQKTRTPAPDLTSAFAIPSPEYFPSRSPSPLPSPIVFPPDTTSMTILADRCSVLEKGVFLCITINFFFCIDTLCCLYSVFVSILKVLSQCEVLMYLVLCFYVLNLCELLGMQLSRC